MSKLPEDWQTKFFANPANEVFEQPLVTEVLEEYADNMNFDPKSGLPAFGMRKIARYAAHVSRALTLGIDPDLLRMSHGPLTKAEERSVYKALKKAGLL